MWHKRLSISVILLVFISCISRSNVGKENERCFEDGTCLGDLICNQDFICVAEEKSVSDIGISDVFSDIQDINTLTDSGEYCYSDSDCSNPEKPYCKKNICVQCISDSDCSMNMICTENKCVQEVIDAGVDVYDVFGYSDVSDGGEDIFGSDVIDLCKDVYCGENAICVSGSCKCNPGFLSCNGTFNDGCEVNSKNDLDNCGGCGSRKNLQCVTDLSVQCNNGEYVFTCQQYCKDEDQSAYNGCEKWNYFPRTYTGLKKIKKIIFDGSDFLFIGFLNDNTEVFGFMDDIGEIKEVYSIKDKNIIFTDIGYSSNNQFYLSGFMDKYIYFMKGYKDDIKSRLNVIQYELSSVGNGSSTTNFVYKDNNWYIATQRNDKLITKIANDFNTYLCKEIRATNYTLYLAKKLIINENGNISIITTLRDNEDNNYISYSSFSDDLSQIKSMKRLIMNPNDFSVLEVKDAIMWKDKIYIVAHMVDKSGTKGIGFITTDNSFNNIFVDYLPGLNIQYIDVVLSSDSKYIYISTSDNSKPAGLIFKYDDTNHSYSAYSMDRYNDINYFNLLPPPYLIAYSDINNTAGLFEIDPSDFSPIVGGCKNVLMSSVSKSFQSSTQWTTEDISDISLRDCTDFKIDTNIIFDVNTIQGITSEAKCTQ